MAEIFMQHSNFQVGNTDNCPYITFWLQYTYLKGLYKNFYTFPNQFFRGSTPKTFLTKKRGKWVNSYVLPNEETNRDGCWTLVREPSFSNATKNVSRVFSLFLWDKRRVGLV